MKLVRTCKFQIRKLHLFAILVFVFVSAPEISIGAGGDENIEIVKIPKLVKTENTRILQKEEDLVNLIEGKGEIGDGEIKTLSQEDSLRLFPESQHLDSTKQSSQDSDSDLGVNISSKVWNYSKKKEKRKIDNHAKMREDVTPMKLAEDAYSIWNAQSKEAQDKTTILCVALLDNKNSIKKFAYTSGPLMNRNARKEAGNRNYNVM
ncbi:MAG: hypothetical protein AAFY41_18420, partial [Bacteroidota bacterium]